MISQVINNPHIDVYENRAVIGLLEAEGRCYGVRTWDLVNQEEDIFVAPHTFLTLGGTSAIYKRTTNPHTTIGDGIALAYEAGCEIADMEFIQFHPSALYTQSEEAFLISEAVRGEGAWLINQQGERFMPAIHELAELAPRDVVAQSIYREMQKHGDEYVWLSLKHLDAGMIRRRFPNIYEKCREYGYDLCDRIPVAPAAHYMVGGVRTDLNGQTNIRNLYIVGELASSGIMGANRLASNSLIECLVFGKRAIEASLANGEAGDVPAFEPQYHANLANAPAYIRLKQEVAQLMTSHAGIVRRAEWLEEGLRKLKQLEEGAPREKDEYYTLASRNLLTVARLIIQSALYRQESRGGHFREDFPESDDAYVCHIVQQKGKAIRTAPIKTNITH